MNFGAMASSAAGSSGESNVFGDIINTALSTGGGGGTTSGTSAPYGKDVVSNILGPLTPQYWMNAKYAKKNAKLDEKLKKLNADQMEIKNELLEEERSRRTNIRNNLFGYRG